MTVDEAESRIGILVDQVESIRRSKSTPQAVKDAEIEMIEWSIKEIKRQAYPDGRKVGGDFVPGRMNN